MKSLVCAFMAGILSLCIVASPSVIAQTQEQGAGTAMGPASEPGQEKMQELSQVLSLSPQQQSQLAPIVRVEKPKVQAVMQDPNLSPSEKKSKLKTVHSQTDPLVKSILNPTQYKQWQTIRNDELENMNMK